MSLRREIIHQRLKTPDADIVLMNQENFSITGKRVTSYFEVSEESQHSLAQPPCPSAERSLVEPCSREWGTFSITHLPSFSDIYQIKACFFLCASETFVADQHIP